MPNHTIETTEGETDADGISESEYDAQSLKNLGNSTLFLPGDTVFWLPYALSEFIQLLPILLRSPI
jgi:hypothetical protein